MSAVRFVPVIALIIGGCGEASPPPQHIQAWVKEWGEMGMYLPSDEQIDFIRANLSDVTPELSAALNHNNPDVRQRAAYVIEKIGPVAKSLGPDLVRRFAIEKERLVRIYLVNAIGRINFQDQTAAKLLRAHFDTLSFENSAPQLFGGYADVDEKINVAAALFNQTSNKDRDKYFDFVTKWLQPPDPKFSQTELAGYWERRWMAVIALEDMSQASAAIPLLEAMLKEPNPKEWVSIHVPRVIAALKRSGT